MASRHVTCGKQCKKSKGRANSHLMSPLPPGIRGGWYGSEPPAEFMRQNPGYQIPKGK